MTWTVSAITTPFIQDSSEPGCRVVKQDGLAIMECRDYCMEEGCNKGVRERNIFIKTVIFVTTIILVF